MKGKLQQKVFEVSGNFRKKGKVQKFRKLIMAHSEAFAREKAYTLFGSKMHIARRHLEIENVCEANSSKGFSQGFLSADKKADGRVRSDG